MWAALKLHGKIKNVAALTMYNTFCSLVNHVDVAMLEITGLKGNL